MADEATAPTGRVKRTPEEKAARKEKREKKLANMSPALLEKHNEKREKRKASRKQAEASVAKSESAE